MKKEHDITKTLFKGFVLSVVIWAGYSAALLIGGLVCLAFQLTVSFFNIWWAMLGVVGVIFVASVLSIVIRRCFERIGGN